MSWVRPTHTNDSLNHYFPLLTPPQETAEWYTIHGQSIQAVLDHTWVQPSDILGVVFWGQEKLSLFRKDLSCFLLEGGTNWFPPGEKFRGTLHIAHHWAQTFLRALCASVTVLGQGPPEVVLILLLLLCLGQIFPLQWTHLGFGFTKQEECFWLWSVFGPAVWTMQIRICKYVVQNSPAAVTLEGGRIIFTSLIKIF